MAHYFQEKNTFEVYLKLKEHASASSLFFPTSIPALLKFTTKYRKSCLLSTAYQPRLKVTIKFINKYKAGQEFTRFFFEDLGSYTAYISYSKAWKMSHDSFLLLSYDIMPPRLET